MTITYTLTDEQYYAIRGLSAALTAMVEGFAHDYPSSAAYALGVVKKAKETGALDAKPHYTPPMLDQNDSLADQYNTLKAFGGENV